MNECPECGGELLSEPDDSENPDVLYGMYCADCNWCSEDDSELDRAEICLYCGGKDNNHKAGCSEDDAIWY